jgi:tetratricopeptide (TPR) repeat protein
MRLCAVLLLAAAACGSERSSGSGSSAGSAIGPGTQAGSSVASDAATTVPTPDAARSDKPAPPTAQQLADYRRRMKAGWALQKQKRWAEAVVEFEAALAAVADAQRALSELGWSAMNAGDFAKARRADEQAVAVAIDKRVKAASLYNLGLVQEKTGDKDGALRSFLASLKLRPHATVEAAIERLGSTPQADPDACEPDVKPCDCLLE